MTAVGKFINNRLYSMPCFTVNRLFFWFICWSGFCMANYYYYLFIYRSFEHLCDDVKCFANDQNVRAKKKMIRWKPWGDVLRHSRWQQLCSVQLSWMLWLRSENYSIYCFEEKRSSFRLFFWFEIFISTKDTCDAFWCLAFSFFRINSIHWWLVWVESALLCSCTSTLCLVHASPFLDLHSSEHWADWEEIFMKYRK